MQKNVSSEVMKNLKNVKSFSLQIWIKIHMDFRVILYPDIPKLLLSYISGISEELFPSLCFHEKERP